MICLHCGREIEDDSADEVRTRWHKRCVKEFFGISELPELDISKSKIEKLVALNVDEGLTIPGVQKKMSLHLEDGVPARLTLVDYPTGYILKPQTDEYENLPEFEWLAMQIAKFVGVKVVPFALYDTGDGLAYLTKRIDRGKNDGDVVRYAMEDFCQLSERLAEDKYKGSYESCARIVRKYSRNLGLDISELFLRLVVSYIVGNSDLHLKNFSLIEDEPGGRVFGLSDAYDILPVNVVEPRDLDEMALSLNGKKRDLEKEDFLVFAEYCGMGRDAGAKMMRRVCEMESGILGLIEVAFLSDEQKAKMYDLVSARVQRLMEQ